jgi:cyclic lactone autoinducer peptide
MVKQASSKQNALIRAVSRVVLYSAKKGCGSVSLASFHQPKEPDSLASRLEEKKKTN